MLVHLILNGGQKGMINLHNKSHTGHGVVIRSLLYLLIHMNYAWQLALSFPILSSYSYCLESRLDYDSLFSCGSLLNTSSIVGA